MSERIELTKTGDHRYGVTVIEGPTRTGHVVTVDDDLLDILGMPDLDEERLVRESFDFLLDREPGTSISREFELGEVRQHFADYLEEIRTRLL